MYLDSRFRGNDKRILMGGHTGPPLHALTPYALTLTPNSLLFLSPHLTAAN